MATQSIVLTSHDLAELKPLVEHGVTSRRRDLEHIEALARELESADVVDAGALTPDVVTLRSRVQVQDLETGSLSTYTIVAPSQADVAERRISVLAPIGTALIGYRVGDVVEWQAPGGTRRLLVAEVLYQPEAAGDEPR